MKQPTTPQLNTAQLNASQLNTPKKKPVYAGIIKMLAALAAVYVLFRKNGVIQPDNNADLSFIVLSFSAIAFSNILSKLTTLFFTGELVSTLCSGIKTAGAGMAAAVIMLQEFMPQNVRSAGIIVLLLTLLAILYRFAKHFLQQHSFYQTLAGLAFTFAVLLLSRETLRRLLPEHITGAIFFQYIEWFLFCAIFVASMVKRLKNLGKNAESPIYPQWAKHTQKIEFEMGNELASASGHFDEFANTGNKSGVLVYIIKECVELGLPFDEIKKMVELLLNYKDKALPLLATKGAFRAAELGNRDRRLLALKQIVKMFKEHREVSK